ncbi:beta-ribofuranosylaminobenzene 5'-phosphate synthase family protein [Methylomicrobium agile]|uniref:beta-ribofuranosylaminobenzene 5'-phosphate synthase family protein n=1 Tax=Methylomicrobium agile TaxID=39774 RepID=UPI0009FF12E7|nr:beta-ribofuranosylaminobenzene 5'-phosphate synthase family protein [Methylomicrobium agile]
MQFRHQKVSVTAPARLHMGFIDLSGALGRHFGSIGVALNEQATRLTVTGSDRRSVAGPSAARAEKCLTRLCEALGVSDALEIRIESAIPEHVGLGSGTQMSLAIGAALSAFYGLGLNVRDIAQVTVRGQRSGIGIGVFEQGGLVVDGGRGEHTATPPLLVRMAIPEAWRFILVFDRRGQGLHGLQEIQAFHALPLFPRREAEQLCYLLLMQALPAIAENDIARFGEVITRLQRSVGEHFAAVQGGIYTSPEVASAMQWLAEQGAVAVGQTSWGPTGFCMVNGADRAAALIEMAERKFAAGGTLAFSSASARNSGGLVVVE